MIATLGGLRALDEVFALPPEPEPRDDGWGLPIETDPPLSCAGRLVPEAEQAPMERLKLRTVLHWIDPVQFAMGEQVLQAAGIPCEQHGRTINSAEDPASVFVVNRLCLRVREQDLERARELLRETVGRGVSGDEPQALS